MSSLWQTPSIMGAATLLSLGHLLNERKHTHRCPLAIREAWAFWDPSEGAPRKFDLALFWGPRPNDDPCKTEPHIPMGDEKLLFKRKSLSFWREVLSNGEGISPPFPQPKAFFLKKGIRQVLVYKDSRCPFFDEVRSIQPLAWRARRKTLLEASFEAAEVFAALGTTLAYAAKPENKPSDTIEMLKSAQAMGEEMGKTALEASFWLHDPERSNLDYDFACREAGQIANDFGTALEAEYFFRSFFKTLAASKDWSKLAQGGEQEAFFPLLCRLEEKWSNMLSAADKTLGIGMGEP